MRRADEVCQSVPSERSIERRRRTAQQGRQAATPGQEARRAIDRTVIAFKAADHFSKVDGLRTGGQGDAAATTARGVKIPQQAKPVDDLDQVVFGNLVNGRHLGHRAAAAGMLGDIDQDAQGVIGETAKLHRRVFIGPHDVGRYDMDQCCGIAARLKLHSRYSF